MQLHCFLRKPIDHRNFSISTGGDVELSLCIEIDKRVTMACFKFWLPWRDHMRRIYVLVWLELSVHVN